MEALEQRVKLCTDEKRQLQKKVSALEKQNSTLMGQLKKLQKIVTEGTRQTAKTGTCAMVRYVYKPNSVKKISWSMICSDLPPHNWTKITRSL